MAASGQSLFQGGPLYEVLTSQADNLLRVNLRKLMPFCSAFMLAFMFLSLGFACGYQFPCLEFVPTFLYIGCFRGLDRFFTMACCYFSLVLLITYVGGHYNLEHVLARPWRRMMLPFGLASITCSRL